MTGAAMVLGYRARRTQTRLRPEGRPELPLARPAEVWGIAAATFIPSAIGVLVAFRSEVPPVSSAGGDWAPAAAAVLALLGYAAYGLVAQLERRGAVGFALWLLTWLLGYASLCGLAYSAFAYGRVEAEAPVAVMALMVLAGLACTTVAYAAVPERMPGFVVDDKVGPRTFGGILGFVVLGTPLVSDRHDFISSQELTWAKMGVGLVGFAVVAYAIAYVGNVGRYVLAGELPNRVRRPSALYGATFVLVCVAFTFDAILRT